jgi:ABC-2 type transport system permease protein
MSEPTSAMWQLFLMRIRALYREPGILFWIFAFPLLTSVALGVAFKNRDLARLAVVVADAPGTEEVTHRLDGTPGLTATRASLEEAREQLRRGTAALVVVPGEPMQVILDPTQPDGRTAKLITLDALERGHGRTDTLSVQESESTAPGSRYIDFLIPGLLGLGLMSSGLWGLGWALVQMRTGGLLKRFVATPMNRSTFLGSFVLSRALLGVAEIGFFLVFARLMFGVRVFGSVFGVVLFAMAGAFSFSGLALLLGSRAKNSETASGLINLASMPMMVLSGVFFASSHFPAWAQPAIRALPLTALNDGLRALMVDGASIASLGREWLVLGVWGIGSFAIALRIFRWT